MIERLLPPAVSCEAARHDGLTTSLFPEEAALLQGATEARRREFATARSCARVALARLGVAAAPILRGSKHEPLWPDGVVGSITHCRGYRAAAVAFSESILTLGIDAEPDGPLPGGVERRVLCDAERQWLTAAPQGVPWDRVIFSAKESIYKAWFPLTGRWLGFDDAVVSIDPAAGVFHARLLVDCLPPFREFTGRFLVEDGLVLTAIALQA
ncbi:MAG TPA: 4'-phosphopantetheinyl transferase superfamily protein [Stellaceae bacterium]|nr:4'-phosphopantetheinyl transferase superfamily protein [Stellaceae bacterium]